MCYYGYVSKGVALLAQSNFVATSLFQLLSFQTLFFKLDIQIR